MGVRVRVGFQDSVKVQNGQKCPLGAFGARGALGGGGSPRPRARGVGNPAVERFFENLEHFWPLIKKSGGFGATIYPLPEEGQRSLVIIITSSWTHQHPSLPHTDKSVTIISIPGLWNMDPPPDQWRAPDQISSDPHSPAPYMGTSSGWSMEEAPGSSSWQGDVCKADCPCSGLRAQTPAAGCKC